MNICFNCVNRTNCSLRKENSGLIWDCSEFSTSSKSTALSSTLNENDTHTDRDADKVSGLCQNCELIDNCTWYRKDAVIFHCEHYQ